MIEDMVPAAGAGGVWIRLKVKFGPRRAEWLLGAITFGIGVVFTLPGDVFGQPAYAGFRAIFGSDVTLGVIMLVLGIARLGGLTVNGARKDVTPWIRVVSAAVGLLIWVGMTAAYGMAGVLGIWAAILPPFAIAEIANCFSAAQDAKSAQGAPKAAQDAKAAHNGLP